MRELKIHPDFSRSVKPLTPEEYTALKQDIVSTGLCREPIVIWNGYIADGHNRYEICRCHGIPFRTEKLNLYSKADVLEWIVNHQLGRRNVTDANRLELALRITGSNLYARKNTAKLTNISEQTVQRYMQVRELSTPERLRLVQNGEMSINAAHRLLELESTIITTLYEADGTEPDPVYEKLKNFFRFMLTHCELWKNADGADCVFDELQKLRKRQHN
jgi:hypothetical protein